MMQMLGFYNKRISWMMICLEPLRVFLLIDKSLTKELKLRKD